MAKSLQTIVKNILGAWIAQDYDKILAEDVVYTVGEGAAKSICHTSGIFSGKSQVQLWYASHTLVFKMYGAAVLNPLCGAVKPPQVVTYEDPSQNTVTAVGTVGLGVRMMLIADSVGGLDQYADARRKQIAKVQAALLKKIK